MHFVVVVAIVIVKVLSRILNISGVVKTVALTGFIVLPCIFFFIRCYRVAGNL